MISTILTDVKWAMRMALSLVLIIIFAVILFVGAATITYTYMNYLAGQEQTKTWNF